MRDNFDFGKENHLRLDVMNNTKLFALIKLDTCVRKI